MSGTPAWREDAECRRQTHIFFPPSELKANAQEAKGICRECPVRDECLDFALENQEYYGIWGGMDRKERAEERRRRIKSWAS